MIAQDVRFAFRGLRRSPSFSAITLLTLALGIGVNTAVYSIINVLLLHPLQYPDAGRLVDISSVNLGSGIRIMSYLKFRRLEEQAKTLDAVAAYYTLPAGLTTPNGPEQVLAAHVSGFFFRMLGAAPSPGRDFTAQENGLGGANVAILSESFWQSHLGSDSSVVGKTLAIDGRATTIIGVMPARFRFPLIQPEPAVWLPRVFENPNYTMDRIMIGASFLLAVGRLRPGESVSSARAELDSICASYRRDLANAPDARGSLSVVPLETSLSADVRPSLLALLVAVGFVQLIACVNVANLLLVRATNRERELAIRRALGASRGRLARQLLTETLVLSSIGGTLGILAVWLGLPLLIRTLTPGIIPLSDQIHVDGPVLLISVLLCGGTGIAVGLLPAWPSSRASGSRIRGLMVISEVALALVLLTGAGLLIRSVVNLMRVHAGFDPANVEVYPISLSPARYPSPTRRIAIFRELYTRARALPGVESAALGSHIPLNAALRYVHACMEGMTCEGLAKDPLLEWNQVTPGYFAAMRIPLLRGREFSDRDTETSPRVGVISKALADRYFPGVDPVGRHLAQSRDKIPIEIVGVAANVKSISLNGPDPDELYVPYTQGTWASMSLVLRPPYAAAVRQIAAQIDPELPIGGIQSMDEIVTGSIAHPRLVAQLIGSFAALAVLLAVIGIYGVMAYVVTQRSKEIAIRMALGAEHADILRLIMGHALKLVAAGILIGAAAAQWLTHFLSTLLFGTSAQGPVTLILSAIIFVAVGLLASYFPARRALRLNTHSVLRCQ